MSDILENCIKLKLVKPVLKAGYIRFIKEIKGIPAARKLINLSYPS
jgi:hypothetical protein